ncbi:Glutathione-dependent formaldehyde-activating enzyme [Aspergillus sclerotialis]|uniref:Glutathione-dependent formaldehyde-activating enzyme n=1 Tax=Aspergillus sclerotialis TaxID=2070753 RepID=A0A3A2ZXX1_9EURO|nr:Glutathione-dependent formaldehyde-activating enzyme [Aspergillus sclerotialis]
MTLQGSCMCGSIAYASDSEPLVKALCHCVDCQKWTGGAFTSNVVVPRDSFKITKGMQNSIYPARCGSPKFYDVTGESGKNNSHFFCQNCGSSLFTEIDIMSDKTIIKAGTLDNGETSLRNKVDVEFYVKDRVPYLGAVQDAQQQPRFT